MGIDFEGENQTCTICFHYEGKKKRFWGSESWNQTSI